MENQIYNGLKPWFYGIMKKSGNVFVLDAQMRSSLAIMRSLGRNGLKVTGGEETRYATGLFSRYCRHRRVYPSAYKETGSFTEYVLDEVKTNQYDVIFPVTEATMLPIVERMDEFSKYTVVPYPPYGVLSKALDRISTVKIALENGIPCPKTYFMGRYGDRGFDELAGMVEYPVVIKPGRYGSKDAVLCESIQDFNEKCKEVDAKYGAFLVQEDTQSLSMIGVYTLFDRRSRPLALTVQQRIRSYPSSGGPGTLRQTIKDQKAASIAVRLLSAMRWVGLAKVEFCIDERDGSLKFMEFSPFFWGSLQLSILAGADFPYLLYRMALGEEVEPNLDYREGIKCRWLLPGDLLWFLSSQNKLKALPSFFSSNTADDIISLDDPGPTLGFFLAVARYFSDREMRGLMLSKM